MRTLTFFSVTLLVVTLSGCGGRNVSLSDSDIQATIQAAVYATSTAQANSANAVNTAVNATLTAVAPTPTVATTEPTGTASFDTPTSEATDTTASRTPLPTSEIPQTYAAFDADFTADPCPLFEGDNETRQYGCDFGEYYMLHKQATTRYTFYDVEYTDAVIEVTGYVTKGTGKYEYGLVFRANTDGSLYYVFTVTNDGKYNVSLYKDEKYTDLIPYTASSAVKTDPIDDNNFKVVMRGARFDFYLNDQYLDSVINTAIAGGVTGLFFYNDEPDVEVGFDRFTVSTFTPVTPTVTSTPGSVAATSTPAATIVAATPTPRAGLATVAPLKSGVYVNSLRFAPRAPKRGEPVTFFVTFTNSTGKAQNYKWLVEIWDADTSKKNPSGQADARQEAVLAGTHELATGDSWKVAGGGPCVPFRARVVYQDEQARRIPFKRTNGADLWVPFQVCP